MTTLVALASKHALVIGSDSLGTQIRRLLDLSSLIPFFEGEGFTLKLSDDGTPVLKNIFELLDATEGIPYNQLQHVNKLFRLGGLPIGVGHVPSSGVNR
jgi:hypothetical protein